MKLSEGLRKGLAIKEKIGRPYCAAVIVAAGTSSRMGGTNKILTVLENLPVICRTVDVFDKCAMIDEIIVVTQQELLEKVSRYLKAYDKMRMSSRRRNADGFRHGGPCRPCPTGRSSSPSTTAHARL